MPASTGTELPRTARPAVNRNDGTTLVNDDGTAATATNGADWGA